MRSRRKQREVERHPPEWAEALNRAILESALDCIITMDASGRVCEFNTAAERVFGFSRAEAVGKELAELIIPLRMREQHRKGLAHYLKTGEGPLLGKRIEIAALRRDGSEIFVELAIAPYRIEGSPVFTAYLRNMTEHRRSTSQAFCFPRGVFSRCDGRSTALATGFLERTAQRLQVHSGSRHSFCALV
jgi:PAS domain S-box-containing protein